MSVENLMDLYIEELKDIYHGEKQLVKALPKMAQKANSSDLRRAFEEHLGQTKGHVQRLEQIFSEMEMTPRAKTCKGLQGIIEEGSEFMEEAEGAAITDAGLIGAGQRAEHYEMASYGSLRAYAQLLGFPTAVSLLGQTLEEEKLADQKLNDLAESGINQAAVEGEAEDDDAMSMGSRNGRSHARNGRTASRSGRSQTRTASRRRTARRTTKSR